MRILVLSKRQYLRKDLLDDRFFRNYEIPEALAARGHQVRGITLSYRRRSEGHLRPGRVEWTSFNAIPHMARYVGALRNEIVTFRPEVLWASSDALHGVIAHWLCGQRSTPYIVDLYDNYDSYGLTRLPFLGHLFRRACREADGLTLIGHGLQDYLQRVYRTGDVPTLVLGNAVRRDLFQPRPKAEARAALGLPADGRLIGTAGALMASRGIEALFEAFLTLAQEQTDLWLVVAGPRDGSVVRYAHERIIDLGNLPFERVPLVFTALDLAVICNLDSPFGRYCFPQKLYEIAACGTPLLAADIGEAKRLLEPAPGSLFRHGSTEALTTALRQRLAHPEPCPAIPLYDWHDRAVQLETFLSNIADKGRRHVP